VKLYLVDYGMVSNEYFYQVGLTDFGNFGTIKFDPPLSVRELVELAARQEKENGGTEDGVEWDEVPELVERQLIERRDMLAEYFSLDVSPSGTLLGIPLLLKGYTPSLTKLPRFLMRLGPCVDWTDEKNCFHTFLRELASFYVPEQLPPPPLAEGEEEDVEIKARREQLGRAVENILFPAFRARLIATRGLLNGVLELANLKGLYRVFERC